MDGRGYRRCGEQTPRSRFRNGACSGTRVELAEDVRNVSLDRTGAQLQADCDIFIGQTNRHQLENVVLSRGEGTVDALLHSAF